VRKVPAREHIAQTMDDLGIAMEGGKGHCGQSTTANQC
jgi:hypothetical protein